MLSKGPAPAVPVALTKSLPPASPQLSLSVFDPFKAESFWTTTLPEPWTRMPLMEFARTWLPSRRLLAPTTISPPFALFATVHPRTTEAVPTNMPPPGPRADPVQPSTPQFSMMLRSRALISAFPLFLTVQRSEEHTSELQSHHDLVCRLLLEK